MSPALAGRFLTTVPPGKSQSIFILEENCYRTVQSETKIKHETLRASPIPGLQLCVVTLSVIRVGNAEKQEFRPGLLKV